MSLAIDIALWILIAPALAAAAYLGLLTLASRGLPAPGKVSPATRFDLVVPAHNEEAVIARTVASLQQLDYPRGMFRIRVVADNCADRTADVAKLAGADVLVRVNAERRGKGYALAHAFEKSLADGFAGAVVVVDADTQVEPNLLTAFDARLQQGAQAVQAEYAVLNPDASWRTRLMAVAFGAFHGVRSNARERLGVSSGLRGNGMCFTAELLRRSPPNAFSVVEDIEYGIQLGLDGVRVQYAHEARVFGEMVSQEEGSRSQRQRWEAGRALLAKTWGVRLIRAGARRREPMLVDLGLDLIVPPLSKVVALCGAAIGATVVGSIAAGHLLTSAWGALFAVAAVAAYVLRGWQLSRVGWQGLTALLHVPAYLFWKVRLLAGAKQPQEWVRTQREGIAP